MNLDKNKCQDFTRAATSWSLIYWPVVACLKHPVSQPFSMSEKSVTIPRLTLTPIVTTGNEAIAHSKVRISTTAGPAGKYRTLMLILLGRNSSWRRSAGFKPRPGFSPLVKLLRKHPGLKKLPKKISISCQLIELNGTGVWFAVN